MEKNFPVSVPGLMFKRFTSKKLEAKILKDKLRHKNPEATQELNSLISELQQLKNLYSFGKNEEAGMIIESFASKLQKLEAKINELTGRSRGLSA